MLFLSTGDNVLRYHGLETLLDLNGLAIEQAGGYWVKFDIHRVSLIKGIPHCIRYSLTLHNRYGDRIMGFDNAHAVKGNEHYDHRHRDASDEGVPYKFVDGYQLLKDFWLAVDKKLNELGIVEDEHG